MTQWGDETICLTSENWPEHYCKSFPSYPEPVLESVVEQEQVVEPVAEASGSSGLKVEIHSSTVFPPKHLWTGASIGRAEQSKCQADQVKRPAANWIIGYNWMWVKMEDLGDHRC